MDYRNTYLVWEIGKPADFVLEIASESTARRDVTEKRVLYAQIGFGEYWRFDGSGGNFYGEPLLGEFLGGWASTVDLRLVVTLKADPMATARRSPYGCIGMTASCDFTIRPPASGCAPAPKNALPQTRRVAAAEQERAAADQARAARQLAEAQVAELQAELSRLRGESA